MNKEIKDKLFSLYKVSSVNLVVSYVIYSLLFLYNQLSLKICIISIFFTTTVTLIFFWTYIKDLFNLINYVKKLGNDNRTKPPILNHVRIDSLSQAINDLNILWIDKQYKFEAKILENDILFNILPDMVMMLDEDSNIVKTNINAKEIFGENLESKNFRQVIDNQLVYDYIKWIIHDKKSKSIEIFLENLQKYFMFRIAKFPSVNSNGIVVIIVITDITETKRNEQMFIDFVANASHEIRTPLSSIKGFVEILQTTGKDDIECHEKFLKIIAEQAERLNSLVKELLSLSKLEFNDKLMNTGKIDIKNIIEISYNDIKHMMIDKNVKFNFQYVKELPNIIGNSNELIQVFSNLFSNAIKYSYNNSEVLVITNIESNNKIIKFGIEHQKWLRIKIIDQSEGIDKEHLPRLTERFYRIDSARARDDKIGGTGLGLSIVKQILNHHQGYLKIESTINVGSTISVYLPIIENSDN